MHNRTLFNAKVIYMYIYLDLIIYFECSEYEYCNKIISVSHHTHSKIKDCNVSMYLRMEMIFRTSIHTHKIRNTPCACQRRN